jgi:hypothetical protein
MRRFLRPSFSAALGETLFGVVCRFVELLGGIEA